MAFLGIGKQTPAQRRRQKARLARRAAKVDARLKRRAIKTKGRVKRRGERVHERQKRKSIRTRRGTDIASTLNVAAGKALPALGELALGGLAGGREGIAEAAAGMMSSFGDQGEPQPERGGQMGAAADRALAEPDDLPAEAPAEDDDEGGLSMGEKVAIGVGAVVVIGGLVYAVTRDGDKKAA